MTQRKLASAACVALGTIRKIERGERGDTDDTLDVAALGVDPSGLIVDGEHASTRTCDALSALSAAIAAYGVADDGPVRLVA
ncbi:helix-turn-helix domain-containing protein [Streptomyces sp. NBC_00057]|uniref:helix-turn-helix domain-containing protein n=1 Tax=Streptomyces sp. NBC_00057 TaxID=2975634 RepID=UPI00386627C1